VRLEARFYSCAPLTSTLDRMNIVLLGAIIWLPVLLTVAVAALRWRKLQNRPLFLVVGALSLFGLQSFTAPSAVFIFMPGTDGLTRASVHAGFIEALQLSGILVLLVGSAVLWWLGNAFRRL
jgi:hypothetical protein